MLTLSGITKEFGPGTPAIAEAGLSLTQGEFIALIGPSGCGKSTLLRIIAGLLPQSSGTITWDGGTRPETGFVFQEPTLMPWASALDNAALPLRLRGIPGDEARAKAAAALAQVGLSGSEEKMPRELSGGMRMRVSLARALAADAGLLLMDEPFAALDEITRNRLNDDLLALRHRRGLTVIFVTHSVYESVYLADRILVMSAKPGRITAEIKIDGPEQRDENFRASSNYGAMCLKTSAALREAMGVAHGL